MEAKRQKARLGGTAARGGGGTGEPRRSGARGVPETGLRLAPARARYGRLLKETKRGTAIDREAVAELERFDGKDFDRAQHDDDTLTAEDMALGYKQQQRVEEAWRTMKSGKKMRPVGYWAPHLHSLPTSPSPVLSLLSAALPPMSLPVGSRGAISGTI